ncbi:unnamed protein product [Bemisia tabaci]|uniref:Uncharacterized protein n=4 Tax=Bemisia tabaci TaxID=7038 RepID=A0A9P0FAR9_BEMTA|nr:unnamed protein product [Bemisia tabaci]
MACDQRKHQCLIFVVYQGTPYDSQSHQPQATGFALYPEALKAVISEDFLSLVGNPLQVLCKDETYPVLDQAIDEDRVEIVELIVDQEAVAGSKFIYAERFNNDIVPVLLGSRAVVHYEAKFHINHVQTALIEEHRTLIDHILSLRPDIRYRHVKGGTFLHLAIERGNETLVRLLLTRGANIATLRNDGSTALHVAAQKGFLPVVQALLDAGADPNGRMKDGSTPLHLAVENGNEDVVRLLLAKGAMVNATALSSSCLGGATPLHIAVEKRNGEMVQLLLESGADVNATAFFGITVLQLAIEQGSGAIVECVLKFAPAVDNVNNKRAFRMAVCQDDGEYDNIVRQLLDKAFMVDKDDVGNAELLLGAIRKNSKPIVLRLLEHGTQINELLGSGFFSATPLHTAARYSSEEMVSLLLSAGADPRARCGRGKTPVEDAFECVNLNALKAFVASNVHDVDDHELFLRAAEEGWLEIIKTLLANSSAITEATIRDPTLLFTAARRGHGNLVEFALGHGADVDARSEDRRTALHEAAANGFAEVTEFLLLSGANVDAVCDTGRTPLFDAALKGETSVVEALLKFGARVDIKDPSWKTALHEAAGKSNFKCLRTLLEYNFTDPSFVSFVYQADAPHGALELSFRHRLLKLMDVEGARVRRQNDLYFGTIEVFAKHAIKSNAADLWFDEKRQPVWKSKELSINECQEELKAMQSEPIGDTNVTFHDVLMGNQSRIAAYVRNHDIVQILNSYHFKHRFPIYGDAVRYQFQKGTLRKELLETGMITCGILFNKYCVLPDDVKEKILNYTSNKDLITLINLFRSERPPDETSLENSGGLLSRMILQLQHYFLPIFRRRHCDHMEF